MIKVRFPKLDVPAVPDVAPPPTSTPRPALLLLRRREFLKGLGALLLLLGTPVTSMQRAWAATRGRFFTGHERATLTALCDRIIPPDADPGAKTLGAPAYIEGLLTAFDHHPVPRIFAGGPFSNRNPFPNNANGTPSKKRPHDAFKQFIALTRLQDLRWRAEILGSTSLYAGKTDELSMALQALDVARGAPLTGLRDVYRTGLASLDTKAQALGGHPFASLSTAQQDQVVASIDTDGATFPVDPRRGVNFLTIVVRHTLEGCFAAPEYGGNKGARGWKMLGLQGDVQPLGYSIFDEATNQYNERSDLPMSTPDPDELQNGVVVPKPLSADGTAILNNIGVLAGALGDACEVS
jgi:hypothetical protein